MKMNIFAVNEIEDTEKFHGREPNGNRTIGVIDPEEDFVQGIDEKYMPVQKLLATRFLAFLSNQRLTLQILKSLPLEEQQRLRKEFLENN